MRPRIARCRAGHWDAADVSRRIAAVITWALAARVAGAVNVEVR